MFKLSDPHLKFIISSGVISASMDFTRSQAARGREGVVLWAGRLLQNGACAITEPIIPKQITGKRFFRIPTEETFRIIEIVATAGMVIPIQLHSHPCEAFHSEADDELAFVQHLNAVSVVVPYFGDFADRDFMQYAVFHRLQEGNNWQVMSRAEVDAAIRIG